MGGPLFLSFEGVDGSGKSTQARRLAAYLKAQNYEVVITREPGGAPGAEEIRQLILTGDVDRWSAETELLLFTAARRDHVERTIWPALANGQIVVCDRFVDSSRVYQGAARGDLRQMVDALHTLMIGVEPDLTIILDMDPQAALRRSLKRLSVVANALSEDRFEGMGLQFQQMLHAGYQQLVVEYPTRCRPISAEGSEDEVFARIWSVVEERLHPS